MTAKYYLCSKSVRSARSAHRRGGGYSVSIITPPLPTVLRQIISVAGDDDADFAFGVAQVTAGSFRLQYEDEITDCIGYVRQTATRRIQRAEGR